MTFQLAPFMAALEEVNARADAAPGFVWRLQTEQGDATALRALVYEEPRTWRSCAGAESASTRSFAFTFQRDFDLCPA